MPISFDGEHGPPDCAADRLGPRVSLRLDQPGEPPVLPFASMVMTRILLRFIMFESKALRSADFQIGSRFVPKGSSVFQPTN